MQVGYVAKLRENGKRAKAATHALHSRSRVPQNIQQFSCTALKSRPKKMLQIEKVAQFKSSIDVQIPCK